MENLKESILTQVLNNANVQINREFYISYDNVRTILNANLVEPSQIINEKNLQEDFMEGLEHLLNRKLTVDQIERLDASDFIDVCIDDMFQAESNSISSYYQQYFVNKKRCLNQYIFHL